MNTNNNSENTSVDELFKRFFPPEVEDAFSKVEIRDFEVKFKLDRESTKKSRREIIDTNIRLGKLSCMVLVTCVATLLLIILTIIFG